MISPLFTILRTSDVMLGLFLIFNLAAVNLILFIRIASFIEELKELTKEKVIHLLFLGLKVSVYMAFPKCLEYHAVILNAKIYALREPIKVDFKV